MTVPAKDDLDLQLSPSRTSPHAATILERWSGASTQARAHSALNCQLGVNYGSNTKDRLDVFTSAAGGGDQPRPIHVFIHGGFWQEGDRSLFHFPAPAFVEAGWIYIALGYTLAPECRLEEIVRQIHTALNWISSNAKAIGGDPARIVVSGHSAGGHLAAGAICGLLGLRPAPVTSAVLISGVFDLEPIRRSYVNDALSLTDIDVANLSPTRFQAPSDISVSYIVGTEESEEFRRQTSLLAEQWNAAADVRQLQSRDHFSILWDLANPQSELFGAVINAHNKKTGGKP